MAPTWFFRLFVVFVLFFSENEGNNTAQQINAFAAKPDGLRWILGAHMIEAEKKFHK